MKKLLSTLLILSLVFALAACGGDKAEEDPAETPEAEGGVLYVGTNPDFQPFEFTDETSGEVVGFDIDLINAIAEDQDLEIELQVLGFDALIPAVQTGTLDIVASGVTINDERLKSVDFSDPYINAGLALAVAEGNDAITGEADLQGKTVAVQIGTTGYDKAQELLAAGILKEVKVLNTVDVVMLELINGGVDAVINDLPVTQAYATKQAGKIKIVGEPLTSESYGFVIKKGNTALQEKLNTGLKNVIANGTYDELMTKYF